MLKPIPLNCDRAPKNVTWVSVCKRGIAHVEPVQSNRSACFDLVSSAGLSAQYADIHKSSLARKGPLFLLQSGTRHYLVLYRCAPRLIYREPRTHIERLLTDFRVGNFGLSAPIIGGAALAGLVSYGAYRGVRRIYKKSSTAITNPTKSTPVKPEASDSAEAADSAEEASETPTPSPKPEPLKPEVIPDPKDLIPIAIVDQQFEDLFKRSVQAYSEMKYEEFPTNSKEMNAFIDKHKDARQKRLACVLHLVHYVSHREFFKTLDAAVDKLVAHCAKHNISQLTMGVFSKNDDYQAPACIWPEGRVESNRDVTIQLMKSNLWVMALVYPRLIENRIAVDFKETENCTILLCDDVLFKGQQMIDTLAWYQLKTNGANVKLIVFAVYSSQMATDKLASVTPYPGESKPEFIHGGSIDLTSDETGSASYKELQKSAEPLQLVNGGYNQMNERFMNRIENWYYFFHKMGDRRAVFEPKGFIMLYEAIEQRRIGSLGSNNCEDLCRRIFPEPKPPYKDAAYNVFIKELCDRQQPDQNIEPDAWEDV